MAHLLCLTQRMQMGFGVSVVVDQLSRRLVDRGHRVTVGCEVFDAAPYPYTVKYLKAHAKTILNYLVAGEETVVVAHTSPYFEVLPELQPFVPCWAWEHGDPTPSLFATDHKQRESRKNWKRDHVYPNVEGVVAISEFVRRDIEWPAAKVIYNGCDHVPNRGKKNVQEVTEPTLRIGTLVRFGAGENSYKGTDLFLELCGKLRDTIPLEVTVMGRGTREDAALLDGSGIKIVLNATEVDKLSFLRNLDIFVSCSRWEGFNLPLVEAQALGTIALALDRGAHKEVTPFVSDSIERLAAAIRALAWDRKKLLADSQLCFEQVRTRFSWDKTTENLEKELLESIPPYIPVATRWTPWDYVQQAVSSSVKGAWESLRWNGLRPTLQKARRRLGFHDRRKRAD
jgi:glycosyltransferase involved in cell wall biosynthesis